MLSPVPQWPDNRLIVPAEATTYLDMMEGWMRERDQARKEGKINYTIYAEPGDGGRGGTPQPRIAPEPPATGSPFAPGMGSPSMSPAGSMEPAPRRPRRTPPPSPPAGAQAPPALRQGGPVGPSCRRGNRARIPGQIPKVRRQYS